MRQQYWNWMFSVGCGQNNSFWNRMWGESWRNWMDGNFNQFWDHNHQSGFNNNYMGGNGFGGNNRYNSSNMNQNQMMMSQN
jgi:hypothetical protein